MKKVKNIVAAAFIGCALLNPIKVYAYDINPSLAVVEESKNNINLKVDDTNSIVKSFQVSFKVAGAKVDSIKWSERIKDNGKADFKDNNGLITVYVTSKVNLVEHDGSIKIGTLVVTGNDGDKFTITPSDMKLVTLNNKSVTASNVNYEGDTEFYTESKSSVDEPITEPTPMPSEPENSENPDNNGTVDKGESDNTEDTKPSDGVNDSINIEPSEEVNNSINTEPVEEISNNKNKVVKKQTAIKTGDYIKAGALVMALGASGILIFVSKKKTYKPKH